MEGSGRSGVCSRVGACLDGVRTLSSRVNSDGLAGTEEKGSSRRRE